MRRGAFYVCLAVMSLGTAMAQPPSSTTSPVQQEQPDEATEAQAAEAQAAKGVVAESGQREAKPRDPFRPFTLDLRPAEIEEPLTPLQRYELAQLRVSAVLLNLTPPRALLEDNSGMGFIVTPGTPIGRRRGVVAAIEPRAVIVEERVLDFYGREQVNRVAMEMAKEDEVQSGIQE